MIALSFPGYVQQHSLSRRYRKSKRSIARHDCRHEDHNDTLSRSSDVGSLKRRKKCKRYSHSNDSGAFNELETYNADQMQKNIARPFKDHNRFSFKPSTSLVNDKDGDTDVCSRFTAPDLLNIHPAPLSLSVHAVDGETPHGMPELVLHVGRPLYGMQRNLLDDILESVLQDALLKSEIETIELDVQRSIALRTSIEYLKLCSWCTRTVQRPRAPPMEKAILIEYFEYRFFLRAQTSKRHLVFSRELPISIRMRDITRKYTDRIFGILKGNAQIPQIRHKMLDKKRLELWQAITQTSRTFKETR